MHADHGKRLRLALGPDAGSSPAQRHGVARPVRPRKRSVAADRRHRSPSGFAEGRRVAHHQCPANLLGVACRQRRPDVRPDLRCCRRRRLVFEECGATPRRSPRCRRCSSRRSNGAEICQNSPVRELEERRRAGAALGDHPYHPDLGVEITIQRSPRSTLATISGLGRWMASPSSNSVASDPTRAASTKRSACLGARTAAGTGTKGASGLLSATASRLGPVVTITMACAGPSHVGNRSPDAPVGEERGVAAERKDNHGDAISNVTNGTLNEYQRRRQTPAPGRHGRGLSNDVGGYRSCAQPCRPLDEKGCRELRFRHTVTRGPEPRRNPLRRADVAWTARKLVAKRGVPFEVPTIRTMSASSPLCAVAG